MSYGAPIASTSRLASAAASVACSSLPTWTMANSSPPSRATVSPSRTHSLQAPRHRLQQVVADRMTERVVDVLEVVEIEAQHGDLLVALHAAQSLLQLLPEQHAVRQVGQRIVPRHVRDLRLGLPPFGDVLERRDPAAARHGLIDHA